MVIMNYKILLFLLLFFMCINIASGDNTVKLTATNVTDQLTNDSDLATHPTLVDDLTDYWFYSDFSGVNETMNISISEYVSYNYVESAGYGAKLQLYNHTSGSYETVIERLDASQYAPYPTEWMNYTANESKYFPLKVRSNQKYSSFLGVYVEVRELQVWRYNIQSITSNLQTESQTNPTQVVTNTSFPYFNWTYSDADNDTQYSWEIQVGTASGLSDMWAPGQLLGTDLNDVYAGSTLGRNTTYYVQVRTNDGYENSTWATCTFKINALPVVSNVVITPSPAVDTDDLTAGNDTATDGNGDSITLYYRWYKDDVLQTALNDLVSINQSNLTSGDVWIVGIIPNDTYENGTQVNSSTVTIGSGNVAPTLTGIQSNVTTKKYGYTVLVSSVDAYDSNNDNYTLHVGTATGLSDICNSSSTANGTEANCSFTINWTSGDHTLYGRLTDDNDTSIEYTVVISVDVTPPVYVLSGVSPSSFTTDKTTSITASITLANGTMDYVKVKVVDNNLISTNYTMSNINGTWTYAYSPIAAGTYSASTFYAADSSGNVMSPQTVSHTFTVTDATGGAGGAGGAPPANITIIEVGDLTLDPDLRDTYLFYTALSGEQHGVYKFIANRNLETCRVEPNTYATCEIVDGYIVLVTLTVNETVKTYDGIVTVTDASNYTTSAPLIVRVVKLWGAIPIWNINVGPLAEMLSIFFEIENTFLIGIRTWVVGMFVGLFGFAIFKAYTS